MVHNGVEYGLMQAYAEGFDVLKGRSAGRLSPAEERYDLNMADIAEVWLRGSVILVVAARPDLAQALAQATPKALAELHRRRRR